MRSRATSSRAGGGGADTTRRRDGAGGGAADSSRRRLRGASTPWPSAVRARGTSRTARLHGTAQYDRALRLQSCERGLVERNALLNRWCNADAKTQMLALIRLPPGKLRLP